jgi:hypothetical protein
MKNQQIIQQACQPSHLAGFSFSPPFGAGERASTNNSPLSLHEKLSLAGRKGGTRTKEKYGIENYRLLGSLGGRPRLSSISGLEAEAEALRANNKEGDRLPEAESLKALKALWRRKMKTGEGCI